MREDELLAMAAEIIAEDAWKRASAELDTLVAEAGHTDGRRATSWNELTTEVRGRLTQQVLGAAEALRAAGLLRQPPPVFTPHTPVANPGRRRVGADWANAAAEKLGMPVPYPEALDEFPGTTAPAPGGSAKTFYIVRDGKIINAITTTLRKSEIDISALGDNVEIMRKEELTNAQLDAYPHHGSRP